MPEAPGLGNGESLRLAPHQLCDSPLNAIMSPMANQRDIDRWKKGKDHWNKWARGRLAAKKKLEEEGKWVQDIKGHYHPDAREWFVSAYVDFSGIVVKQNEGFSELIFPHDANFMDVEFRESAEFWRAAFFGTVRFTNMSIHGIADFMAKFHGDVWFKNTIFENNVRFFDVTFSGSAYFDECFFKGSAEFNGARFVQDALFDASRIEGLFDLAGVVFFRVPSFIQVSFRTPVRLDNMWIIQASSFLIDGNRYRSARYRALKKIAIEAHDHVREQEFFASEIKERRGNDDPKWRAAWCFGLAYEALSDFGRSMLRPLGWMVATIMMFAAVNGTNVLPGWRTTCNWKSDWLLPEFYLSFLHSLPIIGFGRGEKRDQALKCLFGAKEDVSPVIDVVFILQNIWAALLLFLFLLAVRNHFKIK